MIMTTKKEVGGEITVPSVGASKTTQGLAGTKYQSGQRGGSK